MHCRLLALAAGLVAASFALSGQTTPKAAKATNTYTPPKTPWGDPDLQGNWPAQFNIPMQRAGTVKDKEVLIGRGIRANRSESRAAIRKCPKAVRESDHHQSAALLDRGWQENQADVRGGRSAGWKNSALDAASAEDPGSGARRARTRAALSRQGRLLGGFRLLQPLHHARISRPPCCTRSTTSATISSSRPDTS